jgi:hypothetical protein
LIAAFPAPSLPLPSATDLLKDSISFMLHFLPPLFQVLMFVSSTIFTENISQSKYPAYVAYQQRVGMFLPVPWGWIFSKVERKRIDRMLWGTGNEE